jgi:hypothetical protein
MLTSPPIAVRLKGVGLERDNASYHQPSKTLALLLPVSIVAYWGCYTGTGPIDSQADVFGDDSGEEQTIDIEGDREIDEPSDGIGEEPGLPVCAGPVTADFGSGPDGCESPWYHGEQVCPQCVMCGETTDCMAFSEWSDGTCECPGPEYQGDMAIVRPVDGAMLTMTDDVDAEAAGLQVEIVVSAGCWMEYPFEWGIILSIGGDPLLDPEHILEPDAGGLTTGVIDLTGASGRLFICVWPAKDGEYFSGASVMVYVTP